MQQSTHLSSISASSHMLMNVRISPLVVHDSSQDLNRSPESESPSGGSFFIASVGCILSVGSRPLFSLVAQEFQVEVKTRDLNRRSV